MKSEPRKHRRIALASIAMSVCFLAALLAVHVRFDSVLALSQAADSFFDVFTSSAILYSLHVGAKPADWDHPRGHHRAEPIAALIAAVVAGVLAFEVIRSAAEALITGATPEMHWAVAGVFVVKVVGKSGVYVSAQVFGRRAGSPALRALAVDARNDVLVGVVAVGGFFAARYGWQGWDAWLAIPIGLWIAAAGLTLALENMPLLMGQAPPASRQQALRQLAEATPGVRGTHHWKVRYEGAGLDVSLAVLLDEDLTLRRAHDLAQAVEQRLLAEWDVVHVTVHIDVDAPETEAF